jgi:heme/copper-type cytochrome/quinol oxidase subunit 1
MVKKIFGQIILFSSGYVIGVSVASINPEPQHSDQYWYLTILQGVILITVGVLYINYKEIIEKTK